jgi:acyl carrier protein
MIKTISRTQDTILVVDDSGIKTARADHPKWSDIQRIFDLISYEGERFVGPTDELLAVMDLRTAVETYTVGLLSVNSMGVTYSGRPLHTIDAERVMAFMRDKLSYKPIANYIVRKMKNPSSRAIREMYNFLEHRGMPLTLRGTFIAYKGVTTDFWSINGNTETVVLQGEADSTGRLLNKVGATIEVERSSVDDDFRQGCSHGLHAGSLSYAKGWGQRVVLVEIDPADVVSVPSDCNCQKLRCCKYTVVGEYSGPMPDTLTTEFDSESEPDVCHVCGDTDGLCDCDKAEDTAEKTIPTDSQGRTEENMTSGEACPKCNNDKYSCTCNKELLATEADQSNATIAAAVSQTPAENNPTYIKVRAIIAEQLGLNEADIKPDERMDSGLFGMDSLDGVELAMAFEEEFQFEIPDEDAEKAISATVADICKYIEDRLERERARTVTPPADPNFLNGLAEGMQHRSFKIPAKYFAGDDSGADSQPHAQYILGYVTGYANT